MKGPSAVWTMNLDVVPISPHRLLQSEEVKFGAAPVLVTVRYKEFFVLSHMEPRLDSDMKTSMFFIPHAVLHGFVQRIIHVASHAENFVS